MVVPYLQTALEKEKKKKNVTKKIYVHVDSWDWEFQSSNPPQHNCRSEGEFEIRPNSIKSLHREASPSLFTPWAQKNIKPINNDQKPPTEAQSQSSSEEAKVPDIDGEPREKHVESEDPHGHEGQWVHNVLGLKKPLHRTADSEGVELWD